MRIAPTSLILLAALSVPASAASLADRIPDEDMINAMELRAAQAPTKDQCFLYAMLVHDMVEVSARQYASGDVDKATSLLKRAQLFTHKLHKALAADDKRLKDAQILLRHAAFRVNEMLHASSYDDRALIEQTLADLNEVQVDAMMQVFKK